MSQPIQNCFERYEKKYFLTPAGQKALLQIIAPYIKMDFYGKYTICNLYYDTPDWRLIRASLAKPVYKEKLRAGEQPRHGAAVKKDCAAGGCCAILGAEMQKGGMRSAAADRRGRRGPCRGVERLF